MNTPAEPPSSELDLLGWDCEQILSTLTADPSRLARLADVDDARAHNLRLMIADLFWQVLMHAQAVHDLLKGDLATPTDVVQRALYEALTALAYLHLHPQREIEAEVYLAASYIKSMRLFADQTTLVKEREAILRRMPETSVSLARRRLRKHPFTWSGRTIREMMDAGQVTGYSSLYAILSMSTHASLAGSHARLLIDASGTRGTLRMGRRFSDRDRESNANFARRALMKAFQILWEHVGEGRPIRIHSTDPDHWMPLAQ